MSFTISIQKFAEKTKLDMDTVLRVVAMEVLTGVVLKSPVDTGRFRGAWSVNTDELSYAPGHGPRFDKSGALALQAGDVVIQKINAGQTVVISNDVPYGPALEYGLYPNPPKGGTGKTEGGYSRQAPQGMVRLTILQFNEYMQKAVAEIKS